jgi:cyclohexanecarboxylate-CoA ligase
MNSSVIRNEYTADQFGDGLGRTALSLRPPEMIASRFLAQGIWRDSGPLQDLRKWRDETPDAPAILARQVRTGATSHLTYSEYARFVERFAGALTELGVGPRQVVAFQLPGIWQVAPLLLACDLVGAIAAPIIPTLGSRELERTLYRLGASTCITVNSPQDLGYSVSLAEMASRLPRLRHHVVLGSRTSEDEIDFARHFEDILWEESHPVSLDDSLADPDQVNLVLFTSGTTGQPKAALHSNNTNYAIVKAGADAFDAADGYARFYTPHALTHKGGINFSIQLPLFVGGCGIITDAWEPALSSAFLKEAGVTHLGAAPTFLYDLLAELRRRDDRLETLKYVQTMGTMVPADLADAVDQVLRLPLRGVWGMTEGGSTLMACDDPGSYVLHSVGRMASGTELSLRTEHQEITAERPGRLFIRGASVCLATVGRDTGELRVTAECDDGWYDTGDLATWDGQGGIRIMGRTADRIGGAFMIPVNDVESALLQHPGVKDVALVGYSDGKGGELACAVVVPSAPGLTLATLRDYLSRLKMTEWYWPSRLSLVTELPRNSLGKVRKDLLADQLNAEQGQDT